MGGFYQVYVLVSRSGQDVVVFSMPVYRCFSYLQSSLSTFRASCLGSPHDISYRLGIFRENPRKLAFTFRLPLFQPISLWSNSCQDLRCLASARFYHPMQGDPSVLGKHHSLAQLCCFKTAGSVRGEVEK